MSIWDDDHKPYGTAAPGTEADWQAAYDRVMSEEEADEVLQAVNRTPWEILGLQNRTTCEALIKRAFRRIVKAECHEAFGTNAPQAVVDRFKEVHAAYSKLIA